MLSCIVDISMESKGHWEGTQAQLLKHIKVGKALGLRGREAVVGAQACRISEEPEF